jgi:CRP-like cAMP-binding protein
VHDFFTEMSAESLDLLESAQARRSVAPGTVLFLEGEEGHTMYRLVAGAVRLFRSTPDGREVTIHMVDPGDLFAEIVLFERDTYPVSAIALEPSTVTIIRRERVHELLADATFREEFLRNLVGKMRFLSQQLYVLATMDVRARLLRFLEVRYGRRQRIETDLNKQDTAAAISVRPETLSRALTALKEEGLLTWERDTIDLDPEIWDLV